VSTIAPCIQIFHPSIDEFTCTVNDPDVQPTVKDLERVYDLMHTVSEVGPLEDTYGERARERLGDILEASNIEILAIRGLMGLSWWTIPKYRACLWK